MFASPRLWGGISVANDNTALSFRQMALMGHSAIKSRGNQSLYGYLSRELESGGRLKETILLDF